MELMVLRALFIWVGLCHQAHQTLKKLTWASNTGLGNLKRGGEKHSVNQITSKNPTQNCGIKIIGKHKADRNPKLKTTQTRCEGKKGRNSQDKKTVKKNGKEKQSMGERNQEIIEEKGKKCKRCEKLFSVFLFAVFFCWMLPALLTLQGKGGGQADEARGEW